MRSVRVFLLGCLSGVLLSACTVAPRRPPGLVADDGRIRLVICYNADLAPGAGYWTAQASERYRDFVLLMVHGGVLSGEWVTLADSGVIERFEDVVARVRARYPGVRIVAVVCNPGRIESGAPGLTYALGDVWVVPDDAVAPLVGRLRDLPRDGVGDITEFVENGW